VRTDWNTAITVCIVKTQTLKLCSYGILIINNECYYKQHQLFDLCNGDRSVFCQVRTGSLNIVEIIFSLQRIKYKCLFLHASKKKIRNCRKHWQTPRSVILAKSLTLSKYAFHLRFVISGFRRPPYKWGLRYSGIVRSVDWQFVTDVSVQSWSSPRRIQIRLLKKFNVLTLRCDIKSKTFLEDRCLLGVTPCGLVTGSLRFARI